MPRIPPRDFDLAAVRSHRLAAGPGQQVYFLTMSQHDDQTLSSLREAVAALPGNLPLRRQLCEELERSEELVVT